MSNEIILTFHFEKSPTAVSLGEVLVALARDYRDASGGGVLVISRLERSSIIVALTDAALAIEPYAITGMAAVGVFNTLTTFANNIRKWMERAKSDDGGKHLYRRGRKAPGQRSVEAIVTAAVDMESIVGLKYTSTDRGETLEVELSPAEARRARAISEAQKTAEIGRERPRSLMPPPVEQALARLHQAGTENLSPLQIQSVVEVIVAALKLAGVSHTLPVIAADLERHGLHEFARVVRQHIRGTGGTEEPPLMIT